MKKVWVNGSFDILHLGHIKLLEFASTFGNVRVGLDSDNRIREKKGEGRPYNTLEDRVEFMRGIKFVNDIVTFSTNDGLIESIRDYQPDLMVIGDDYNYHTIIGIEYIPKVVFFNKLKGKSTTNILRYENNSNRGKM